MKKRNEPRRLTAAELDQFDRAMGATTPLHKRPLPTPQTLPKPVPVMARPRYQGSATASGEPGPIDRRTARKVERGRIRIEARLDLHGIYQEAAYAKLIAFVQEQALAGKRCVLVITGKGDIAPPPHGEASRGVLRRLVPMWLAAPEVRPCVDGLRSAAVQHGGAGAYYVLLKRPK